MFSVIFEVHPRPEQWDAYLGNAKMLRPELEAMEGFIDNIRFKSLTREGWILSLSNWRDEKSLVRWRTKMRHHEVQEKGRGEILMDYHLRVGQLFQDTQLPQGLALTDQRLDETEVGEGTTLSLITAQRPIDPRGTRDVEDCATFLGLHRTAEGLLGWDVFEAVLAPEELVLLLSWRNRVAAERFEKTLDLPATHRLRHVRVVRDYGMFDRREAPQYYPEVPQQR